MDAHRHFLRGEIDISNVDALGAQLVQVSAAHPGDLIIDCMDLEFIDCAAVEMLKALATVFADDGRYVRLAYPTRILTRMLEIVGADDLVIEPVASPSRDTDARAQVIPVSLPVARLRTRRDA